MAYGKTKAMKDTILKNPNFISLWTSQILSQLTVNVLSFVILIRLYEITNSQIATSLLWVAYALPAIVIGPFTAAIADLVDKRKLLMIANILQCLIVLSYGLFFVDKIIFFAYIIVFLYAFLNQFYVPAEAAAMPLFLPHDKLAQANGLFFITQQSALLLGLGVGGLLLESVGFRPTILIASFALLIAFFSVSFLPTQKIKPRSSLSFEAKVEEFFRSIAEGYRFIKNNKVVLLPFTLLLGFQVVIAVIVMSMPPLAEKIVMIKPTSAGLVIALPAGIGAMFATGVVSRLLANKVRKKKIILSSLFVFSVVIALISVLPQISLHPLRIFVSTLLFGVTGFLVVSILVPSITFMQEKTPKDLLGRVFGNFWFLTTITTIVPVISSATVTEVFGIRTLILALSAFCFAVFVVSNYKVKEI